MKVTYQIPIEEKDLILGNSKQYTFDGICVEWDVDSKNNLNYINLIISGIPIEKLKELKQRDNNPEVMKLRERMFSVMSYIANRILIEKGRDILDLDYVKNVGFCISPETIDEERYFPKGTIESGAILLLKANIINKALKLPDDFERGFKFSEAYAHYVEGLRVLSPFLRYEQFYKVIEHFFKKKGEKLDLAVSLHVSKYDKGFDHNQIEKLRNLRNRIVHPRKRGHLNPSDIVSTREVEAALPLLHGLIKVLLQNPPESAAKKGL